MLKIANRMTKRTKIMASIICLCRLCELILTLDISILVWGHLVQFEILISKMLFLCRYFNI